MTWQNKIKLYLDKHGITQATFAEACDIPLSNIKKWASGLFDPDKRYQKRLTEIFDCDIFVYWHDIGHGISVVFDDNGLVELVRGDLDEIFGESPGLQGDVEHWADEYTTGEIRAGKMEDA